MTVRIKQKVRRSHNLVAQPEAARKAFEAAAAAFVDQVIPRHFTAEGAAEYGYEARDAGYTRRKVRAFGHQRPNEFTGETRRRAEAPQVRQLGHSRRRAAGGASIQMRLPNYITNSAARRREMEATSSRDSDILTKEIDRVLTRILNQRGPNREV